jgi:threonine aldolase
MARRLAEGLRKAVKVDTVFPVEANAVFVRLSEQLVRDLQVHGWQFYKFIEPDIYRLMCSWSTTAADVDAFVSDLGCIREKSSL